VSNLPTREFVFTNKGTTFVTIVANINLNVIWSVGGVSGVMIVYVVYTYKVGRRSNANTRVLRY